MERPGSSARAAARGRVAASRRAQGRRRRSLGPLSLSSRPPSGRERHPPGRSRLGRSAAFVALSSSRASQHARAPLGNSFRRRLPGEVARVERRGPTSFQRAWSISPVGLWALGPIPSPRPPRRWLRLIFGNASVRVCWTCAWWSRFGPVQSALGRPCRKPLCPARLRFSAGFAFVAASAAFLAAHGAVRRPGALSVSNRDLLSGRRF